MPRKKRTQGVSHGIVNPSDLALPVNSNLSAKALERRQATLNAGCPSMFPAFFMKRIYDPGSEVFITDAGKFCVFYSKYGELAENAKNSIDALIVRDAKLTHYVSVSAQGRGTHHHYLEIQSLQPTFDRETNFRASMQLISKICKHSPNTCRSERVLIGIDYEKSTMQEALTGLKEAAVGTAGRSIYAAGIKVVPLEKKQANSDDMLAASPAADTDEVDFFFASLAASYTSSSSSTSLSQQMLLEAKADDELDNDSDAAVLYPPKKKARLSSLSFVGGSAMAPLGNDGFMPLLEELRLEEVQEVGRLGRKM